MLTVDDRVQPTEPIIHDPSNPRYQR